MKQDIKFNIRALVVILRQSNVKVRVDFNKCNNSQLVGIYGELCKAIRERIDKNTLLVDVVQARWLRTMGVCPRKWPVPINESQIDYVFADEALDITKAIDKAASRPATE